LTAARPIIDQAAIDPEPDSRLKICVLRLDGEAQDLQN
jgi:hypothetical protein